MQKMAKRSKARSAGKVYVPPIHRLSCDSRCGPDIYSPDIIGSYIFFKTAGDGWQFAKVVGLAEDAESVMFPHTIKMLDWGNGLTCTFDANNSRRRTAAVTRERGAGIYILAEVASVIHIRCLDVNVDYYGLVATHRSHVLGNICILCGSVLAAVVPLVVREGAVFLVELRDGRCDNDDVTFDSNSFLYIEILC